VLHRVVQREPRDHRPSGRVDVEEEGLAAVLRIGEQQRRDALVAHVVVDLLPQEDEPLAVERLVGLRRRAGGRTLKEGEQSSGGGMRRRRR